MFLTISFALLSKGISGLLVRLAADHGEREALVVFSPHPSAYMHFSRVAAAIAMAHDVPLTPEVLARLVIKPYSLIQSIVKVDGRAEYTLLNVSGTRRYVLADGTLVHNCATGQVETADAKNTALKTVGVRVPTSFEDFGSILNELYVELVKNGTIQQFVEPPVPSIPVDYEWSVCDCE